MPKKHAIQFARPAAAKEVPNPRPEEVPPVKDPAPSQPPQEVPHVPESTPPPQPREVPGPVDPPEPTPPSSIQHSSIQHSSIQHSSTRIGGSNEQRVFGRRCGQIKPGGIADAYRVSLLNRSRTTSIT